MPKRHSGIFFSQLSCSTNPTTNSKTRNHEGVSGFYLTNQTDKQNTCKTCSNWQKNIRFIVSKLVVGYSEVSSWLNFSPPTNYDFVLLYPYEKNVLFLKDVWCPFCVFWTAFQACSIYQSRLWHNLSQDATNFYLNLNNYYWNSLTTGYERGITNLKYSTLNAKRSLIRNNTM